MEHQEWMLLLLSGVCLLAGLNSRIMEYHFVNQKLNWTDAREYCQYMYTDLAVFPTPEDLLGLNTAGLGTERAWIGLADDPAAWKEVIALNLNSWRWSYYYSDWFAEYQNWAPNEPNYYRASETCVVMFRNGTWYDEICSELYPFICVQVTRGGGLRTTYFLFETKKNWTDAQTFCRTNYLDLAIIPGIDFNTMATEVMTLPSAWIGLYRKPWVWVDNSPLTFSSWQSFPPQPDNNLTNEHCGAMNAAMLWDDEQCSNHLSFFCHGPLNFVEPTKMFKTSVKFAIPVDFDLFNSTLNDQLLQQLEAELKAKGLEDIRLSWKTPPEKEEEEEDINEILYQYDLCEKEFT